MGPSAQSEAGRGARRPPGVVKLSEGWGGIAMQRGAEEEACIKPQGKRERWFGALKELQCSGVEKNRTARGGQRKSH